VCGRFSLSILPEQFRLVFGTAPPADARPRWNITPDSDIVVVRAAAAGGIEAVCVRWGLLGPWMKEANDPGRQINARSESLFEKPMFRDAARKSRCLIPADGFYEWAKSGKGPGRPWRIQLRSGEPFGFAGIWRRVRLADGEVLESCAILTTEAWPSIRGIHHRMPVILPQESHELWLDPTVTLPEVVQALIVPRPESEFLAFEISRRVNNPREDDPSIVEPIAPAAPSAPPAPPAQGRLL
jgi:putative SOS response-associated peptidase YedK